VTIDEDRLYLLRWAESNGCNLETRGTVGFGRPAVGIIRDHSYVELGPTVTKHYTNLGDVDDQEISEGAYPPDGVEDAYHKHDCLCVLAHGEDDAEDHDAALVQLAIWVRHLEAGGYRVATAYRKPSSNIDMLVHGIETAWLTTEGRR
jgi:hypothetical protein